MTRLSLVSVASFSAIAILTAAPAFAEPKPVQVLAVQSDNAVDQAQALTAALKSSAKHQPSVKLVQGDYSLEVLSLALGCPDTPDDACLAKIASKIKSEAFVWGTLQKDAGKLDLKLNFYERGAPNRATVVRYNAGKADEQALTDIADRALAKLLADAPHAAAATTREETGTLLLSAEDISGDIVIDGAPAGAIQDGHAQLDLSLGEHDVSVRADGYRDAQGTVTISSGKRALLRLHPEKIGGSHGQSADDSGGNESNAGAGWGAIIVGGAFAGLGVYSTLRVNAINHDSEFDSYRAGISRNDDACVEANRNVVVTGATSPNRISDLCSQSKTFEALQYVFFGLGAVAAGTGALILITDDKAPAPSPKEQTDAQRTPRKQTAGVYPSFSVGPHSAAIDLRLRF